jgi:hypothetical protein
MSIYKSTRKGMGSVGRLRGEGVMELACDLLKEHLAALHGAWRVGVFLLLLLVMMVLLLLRMALCDVGGGGIKRNRSWVVRMLRIELGWVDEIGVSGGGRVRIALGMRGIGVVGGDHRGEGVCKVHRVWVVAILSEGVWEDRLGEESGGVEDVVGAAGWGDAGGGC